MCQCEDGFTLADCSGIACPEDCNSHGVCQTATGECECNFGWNGTLCDVALCPFDCNNHGECQDDLTCKCDKGWLGLACEIEEEMIERCVCVCVCVITDGSV